MNRRLALAIAAVVVVAAAAAATLTLHTTQAKPLQIYVADAYTGEAQLLASAYHNATGAPTPLVTGGGSFALAQEIGMGAAADVFMPVSIAAVQPSYLHNYAPGWAIAIAADQMVLAYTNVSASSQAARDVLANYTLAQRNPQDNATYWYWVFWTLSSGLLRVGISNPNADPAGYRGWIVLEAAGYLYAHNTTFFVKRMLETSSNYTAQHAAELVAPLTAGQINFLFIYRSAAIAKNLEYLQLPPQINLGDPAYAQLYAKFNYTVSTGVLKGAPIYLYITVPLTAKQAAQAYRFVAFVVENVGLLERFGLTPLEPAYLYNATTPPAQIAQLMSGGYVKYAGPL